MCGILGTIGNIPEKKVFINSLGKIKHRGPDDDGFFYDAKAGIALGQNRLSIIDLSEAGHQPFISQDGRYTLVFNGEIYNYLELREELKSDFDFRTNTDTEVLLAAFIKWGKDCVSRFNGMFAFALWDKKVERLFCARDRLGIKPFYYFGNSDSLIFASEIKALLGFGIPRVVDQASVYDYLYYGFYDHTERTFFKDIEKLPAGHFMIVEKGKREIRRYWDLDKSRYDYDAMTDNEIEEEFLGLLKDSIKLRFRSDVPVGLNLSSGLDSNSLYYLAEHSLGIKDLNIFSMTLPSEEYDECRLIEKYLSKSQKKYWNKSLLEPGDVFEIAEKMNLVQDQPYGGIPTIAYDGLNEEIAKTSVKVVLEGQGVDELLAGYRYYQVELEKDKREEKLNNNIHSFDYSQDMTKLIDSDILDSDFIAKNRKELSFEKKFSSNLLSAQYRDIMYAKLPRVLRFNDHVSMRYGLELRVPYLDHRIVEFCFWLPHKYKINKDSQKYLLRKVMSDKMPKIVNNNEKKAFGAIQTEWFRKDYKEEVYSIINSDTFKSRGYWDNDRLKIKIDNFFNGQGDNSFFIWQCVNLELWLREFID
jgi:asparagine synthase (glutamine-hydrolysing)